MGLDLQLARHIDVPTRTGLCHAAVRQAAASHHPGDGVAAADDHAAEDHLARGAQGGPIGELDADTIVLDQVTAGCTDLRHSCGDVASQHPVAAGGHQRCGVLRTDRLKRDVLSDIQVDAARTGTGQRHGPRVQLQIARVVVRAQSACAQADGLASRRRLEQGTLGRGAVQDTAGRAGQGDVASEAGHAHQGDIVSRLHIQIRGHHQTGAADLGQGACVHGELQALRRHRPRHGQVTRRLVEHRLTRRFHRAHHDTALGVEVVAGAAGAGVGRQHR